MTCYIMYYYVDRVHYYDVIVLITEYIIHVIILPLEIYTKLLALHIKYSAIMCYARVMHFSSDFHSVL